MPVAFGGPNRKGIPSKHVATDEDPGTVDWPRAVGASAQFGTDPVRNGPALIARAARRTASPAPRDVLYAVAAVLNIGKSS